MRKVCGNDTITLVKYNKSYLSPDPEEFLNMLFKHTLHVDPFIHIK